MDLDRRPEISQILREFKRTGDRDAELAERFYVLVYAELRSIAKRLMRGERGDHTLQPTALVHEAYLRLVEQKDVEWQCRAHFYAVAARIMRRILVDHARYKAREKRGGKAPHITWDEELGIADTTVLETLALDRALCRLSELDERMERVVELRIFGGMTIREVAHALGISRRTVDNDWFVAKQWLARELAQ